jgi:hypothetical protein
MKLLTLRKNNRRITDEEALDAVRRIATELMEHGSVTIFTGTEESAALIHAMSKFNCYEKGVA